MIVKRNTKLASDDSASYRTLGRVESYKVRFSVYAFIYAVVRYSCILLPFLIASYMHFYLNDMHCIIS